MVPHILNIDDTIWRCQVGFVLLLAVTRELAKRPHALAEMGATLVMVVRNQEKGEKALSEIVEQTGNKSVSLMLCDMSSMASITNFAKYFKKKYSRLDVLVNNAGGEFSKR